MRPGELTQAVRAGGHEGREALRNLQLDKLTPGDIAELKQLLPQIKEQFGPQVAAALARILEGKIPDEATDLKLLLPDLGDLRDAKELPGRFTSDLKLVRPLLTAHPGSTREEKATRLFAFLGPFAEKLAQLSNKQLPEGKWKAPAHGEPPKTPLRPPLPPKEREAVAAKLLAEVRGAGFHELKDKRSGKNGVDAAHELLEAKTPEHVRKAMARAQLDAPGWPQTETRSAEAQPQPQPQPQAWAAQQAGPVPQAAPALTPSQPGLRQDDEAKLEEEQQRRSRRGKLGGGTLWNVLHLFRDDGEHGRDSAAQRDKMNRLVIAMVAALAVLTLLAAVLASM